jgi:Raf kinase inhibitor-like YbhB/YbcL family protein
LIARGIVAVLALLLVAANGAAPVPFAIESPSFTHRGEIPTRFTCEGEDVSPELQWSQPPDGTQSFVLIVEDPDAPDPKAPKTTWIHWVLYDLPAEATGIREAVTEDGLPAGTRQGRNSWKRTGYGGPCPPIGRHRYFYRLYALDTRLPGLKEPSKADLEQAMQGHVLARVEIVGTYRKQGKP